MAKIGRLGLPWDPQPKPGLGDPAEMRLFGPTASVVTIGDEVVEARISNENATWIVENLLTLGYWPRLVIAVPDDEALIVRVLRVAADSTDVVIISGGLGFTPDDITRRAVASAYHRSLCVNRAIAADIERNYPWASAGVAEVISTFPEGADPIPSLCGRVPGFSIGDVHVLPGSPTEMRAMFQNLSLMSGTPARVTTVTLMCLATEDFLHEALTAFSALRN